MNERPMLRQNYSSREDRDANRDAMWTARDDDGCCLFAGFAFRVIRAVCPQFLMQPLKFQPMQISQNELFYALFHDFPLGFRLVLFKPRASCVCVRKLLHSAAKSGSSRQKTVQGNLVED